MRLGGAAGGLVLKRDPNARPIPQLAHMLARISFRQIPLAARVYARSYTSSIREGSVAASKEFGYAFTAFSSCLGMAMTNYFL